jgi:hypothetical protein
LEPIEVLNLDATLISTNAFVHIYFIRKLDLI